MLKANNEKINKQHSLRLIHQFVYQAFWGVNQIDAKTTWNKQEWMVDEVASELMRNKKTRDFIIVAIHNIPEIRWQDYFRRKHFIY